MRTTRALTSTTVCLVAASLLLAGCGGGGSKPQSGKSGGASATTTPAPSTWPLTGLSSAPGASVTNHPVFIAKIDNTSASYPQYGLSKADLVTEELVEGGITRLAAFFYSDLPTKVGPIRSMRQSDVGIAKPVNARIVASGAAGDTIATLNQAHVRYYTLDGGSKGIVRDYDHSHDYLHSVIANIQELAAGAKTAKTRPEDYLPWGTDADFTGTAPATSISAKFGGARTSVWSFAGGKYTLGKGPCSNCGNNMGKDDQFQPDTVIAITVRTTVASYRDPAGNPVPITHFTGRGQAVIFHAGKAEPVTWVKNGEDKTVTFQDATGKAVKVPAGHVWLELVPKDGGVVSYQ